MAESFFRVRLVFHEKVGTSWAAFRAVDLDSPETIKDANIQLAYKGGGNQLTFSLNRNDPAFQGLFVEEHPLMLVSVEFMDTRDSDGWWDAENGMFEIKEIGSEEADPDGFVKVTLKEYGASVLEKLPFDFLGAGLTVTTTENQSTVTENPATVIGSALDAVDSSIFGGADWVEDPVPGGYAPTIVVSPAKSMADMVRDYESLGVTRCYWLGTQLQISYHKKIVDGGHGTYFGFSVDDGGVATTGAPKTAVYDGITDAAVWYKPSEVTPHARVFVTAASPALYTARRFKNVTAPQEITTEMAALNWGTNTLFSDYEEAYEAPYSVKRSRKVNASLSNWLPLTKTGYKPGVFYKLRTLNSDGTTASMETMRLESIRLSSSYNDSNGFTTWSADLEFGYPETKLSDVLRRIQSAMPTTPGS